RDSGVRPIWLCCSYEGFLFGGTAVQRFDRPVNSLKQTCRDREICKEFCQCCLTICGSQHAVILLVSVVKNLRHSCHTSSVDRRVQRMASQEALRKRIRSVATRRRTVF
uniref:Secreted protein n=1 Tax=Ascaris lumbricoides TaxID=6252 RepID=A0A0M3I497_ASCLU